MRKSTALLVALAGLFFSSSLAVVSSACTKTQGDLAWAVLRDSTGAACPIVLQATLPGLVPLCVSLSELETVIRELSSTAAKSGADAGLASAPFSPDELYQAVLAHRAKAQP